MERTDRIAAEMKRVVSDIIRTELKDPRIPVVTSVTRLKLAKDLKFAKIYVSCLGNEAEKNLYDTDIFNLQGIKADTPSKGIHIIRYSDGTVKKVYTR